MTFDNWVKKYEGKTWGYPTQNLFYGECLSLTKWHIKEVHGINPPPSGCNAAKCYWTKFPDPLGTVFKRVPNTPTLIPKKGWIAVWDENVGGGYGHIASVLEADINKFVSLDQNWNGQRAHRVTHNYDHIYGFLVPLDEEEGEDMVEVPSDTYEMLVDKATKYDEFVKAGYTSVDDVNKKVNQLETDLTNCRTEKKELEEKLKDCEEPVVKPDPELPDGRLNGFTREYTVGNVKVVENYAVDE